MRENTEREKQQKKGDILEYSGTVCNKVFCLKFCHDKGTGSCKMMGEDTAFIAVIGALHTPSFDKVGAAIKLECGTMAQGEFEECT